MTEIGPMIANFFRPTRISSTLAHALSKRGVRHAYMARQLKLFLADQIKALRGDLTQSEFGRKIGKPQSVISRIEKQADRNISIQTLIDIAEKLDIGVIIRFVDFPTFLKYTDDYSDAALVPQSYKQEAIEALVRQEEARTAGPRVIEDLIRRQSEAQLEHLPLEHLPMEPQSDLRQPLPIGNAAAPLARIIPFPPPVQQRFDERIMRNVGQSPRLAS